MESKARSTRFAALYNLLILFGGILLFVAAVGTGLGLFFALQNEEIRLMDVDLKAIASLQNQNLQRIFSVTIRENIMLRAQIATAGANMTLNDFELFVASSELFYSGSPYFNLEYMPLVMPQDLDTFMANAKKLRPEYANFWVTERTSDGNFKNVTRTGRTAYHPLYYVLPVTANNAILGFDLGSEPVRAATVQRAITTRQPVISGKILLAEEKKPVPAIIMLVPAYDKTTNAYFGCAQSLFRLDTLIETAFKDIGSDVLAAVFDVNATTNDDSFIHNTFDKTDLISYARTIEVLNAAPGQLTSVLTFADRQYKIVFASTSSFVNARRRPEKWIGLFIPMAVAMLFFLMLIFVVKRLEYSANVKFLQEEKLHLLDQNKEKLERLVNRIALEENKTSAILDGIQEGIMAVEAASGKILFSNAKLKKIVEMSDEEMTNTTVFMLLGNNSDLVNILREQRQEFEVIVKNKTGIAFSVLLTCTMGKMVIDATHENKQVEVFVISLRDMRDHVAMLQQLGIDAKATSEQLNDEFDRMLATPTLRFAFQEFCKKEYTEENWNFLEDVEQYKKTSAVQTRVEMQAAMFHKYMRVNANHQLNVSQDIIKAEAFKIDKGLGQIDLFDSLARLVKNQLVHDTFKRWTEKQKI